MKIIRHTARDMRQALRAVREQLGEDAVILSSRRTGDGVEVTAAVDFDASTLEAGGFAGGPAKVAPLPAALPQIIDATNVSNLSRGAGSSRTAVTPHNSSSPRAPGSLSATAFALTTGRAPPPLAVAPSYDELAGPGQTADHGDSFDAGFDAGVSYAQPAGPRASRSAPASSAPANYNGPGTNRGAVYHPGYESDWISEAAREAVAEHLAGEHAPVLAPATAVATAAAHRAETSQHAEFAPRVGAPASVTAEAQHADFAPRDASTRTTARAANSAVARPAAVEAQHAARTSMGAAFRAIAEKKLDDRDAAADADTDYVPSRESMTRAAANATAQRNIVAEVPARRPVAVEAPAQRRFAAEAPTQREIAAEAASRSYAVDANDPVDPYIAASYEVTAHSDPVEEIREATLTPLASNEVKSNSTEFQATAAAAAAAATPGTNEAMSNELKTLRHMLENQLAHLAWNDLTRRAPVHTEILRELTEIGITRDLAEHLARQLPEDTDLTFARRFTIAGLSQYLKVTGDRWLDDGGRVAFVGATGVGKTTTLAKIAVRWVLRHGARDIALIAADPVRIGAQDQMRSLAQLLGVPVYTPESFDHLPALLSRLSERLVLIDTPGSSVRDTQLAGRMAVLSNSASKLETALVLAASTQAGAIEETVRRFAPANPSCCVLTKIDEAASLGGVLSALIRARLPVSYMSEGQRVPEDLRPARALELVSAAVRLAKARGAAADEDLLRRRFGKNAHGIS